MDENETTRMSEFHINVTYTLVVEAPDSEAAVEQVQAMVGRDEFDPSTDLGEPVVFDADSSV